MRRSFLSRGYGVILAVCMAIIGVTASSQAGAKRADLSRLGVLGDSLMAGYQNTSLRATQQVNSIPALITREAGYEITQPLIEGPGIPNALSILDFGPPMVIGPVAGTSTGRVNPLEQALNLSVPAQGVWDALHRRPDFPIDSMTDLVLGLPGLLGGVAKSQVEWLEALQPTTVIVWLGANDTLWAAINGDVAFVTSAEVFSAAYSEIMDRVAALGVPTVVANIPDVCVIPYLTPAEAVAANIGLPLSTVGPLLGLLPGDYITPNALPLIPARLQNPATGPLPADVVLSAAEIAYVREATAVFNEIIVTEAREHGFPLVDTHKFLNELNVNGLVVAGQRLTTDFLGGIFTLDGIHPTNVGAAATANEFIHALNTHYAAGIPPVNVRKVIDTDPLVVPGVGHPASAVK